MQQVMATYRAGRIELDAPVDWPDGTRIQVEPLHSGIPVGRSSPSVRREFLDALENSGEYGLDENLWPLSAQETQILLAAMDAAEPLDLSPEEIDRMEGEWRESKALQKELVRKSWEGTDGSLE
jgi:hypothetical protein